VLKEKCNSFDMGNFQKKVLLVSPTPMVEAAGFSVIFLMSLHSAYIFFSTLYTREFKMDKTMHRIIYGISEMSKCCEFNMQCVTVNNFCKLLPHK
jgi:hypothetical protein